MPQYLIGVDIGGTTTKYGLFLLTGELVEKWTHPTRIQNQGIAVLPDVADSIHARLAQRGISLNDLFAVGVGVPAPVRKMRYTIGACNLGWGATDILAVLAPLLKGVPVFAANDSNLAALAEAHFGAGRGFRSLNMITLGTGVGSGIILDGKIWEGAHGSAGEYGQSRPGSFGFYPGIDRGRLEDYSSATGVVRVYERLMLQSGRCLPEGMDAKGIFDLAREHDAVAQQTIDIMGRNLACLLSIVGAVVDPEAYIFGGGVSRAGQILIDRIRQYYVTGTYLVRENPQFLLAELGNNAGIYGAAKLALDMRASG